MPAARPYLVFDTETTDLLPDLRHPDRDPFVVSLAWGLYSPRGRELQPPAYAILRPPRGRAIPETGPAFEKHRVTDARARAEGRPRAEVLAEFVDALGGARAIVAHKLRFDRAVVARELPPGRARSAVAEAAGVCTMDLAEERRPSPTLRLGLADVHAWAVGVPLERPDGTHDALDDMRACARIFFALGGARAARPARA